MSRTEHRRVWPAHIQQDSTLWRRNLRLHLDEHFYQEEQSEEEQDAYIYLYLIRLVFAVFESTFRATPDYEEVERFQDAMYNSVSIMEPQPNLTVFGNRTALEETSAMFVDMLSTNPPIKRSHIRNIFKIVWWCFRVMMDFPKISSTSLKHAMLRLALFVGSPCFSSEQINPYVRVLAHAVYDHMEVFESRLDP